MTTPASPGRGFDPEAEQEVDFASYGRMLAMRWWLLAAGLVAGAVIGYLVSLGSAQVYTAQATIYLGQPYSPTGGNPVITPQTNPSAVGQVIKSQAVDNRVATQCGLKNPAKFRNGTSTQVNPLVTVAVQTRKGKVATCAANALARAVVTAIGTYPARQIVNYEAHIAFDNKDIRTIDAAIADPSISTTDKLILQTTLRSDQLDLSTYSGLLLEAKNVELPRVLTPAAAHKTTARSRRNTVLIAAIIGLILGALAALLWDRVVPRLFPRNGE